MSGYMLGSPSLGKLPDPLADSVKLGFGFKCGGLWSA